MKHSYIIGILTLMIGSIILSCNKKDDYMAYTPGKGSPSITSVYTYSQYKYNDTTITTHSSYDTSGNLTTYTDTTIGNTLIGLDSATSYGNLGEYYVIHGKNLGSATEVYFNGTQAYFNRALGTDETIIVQIPSTTPYRKPRATDSLTVVNLYGKASYPFMIIAPAPTIQVSNGVSNYNFKNGSVDTLYGVGFASTDNLYIKGVSSSSASKGLMDQVDILSVNDSVMIVKFPDSKITQGNLLFAYTQTDGSKDTAISSTVFNNIDKAYQIFANDNTQNGWGSWSWDAAGISTDYAKSGTKTFSMKFSGGGWKVDGLRQGGGGASDGLAYSADWQYLVFWVKGGNKAQTAYIQWGDGGLGQNAVNDITIAANKWQFFKIPISSLKWNTTSTTWSDNKGSKLNTVGFFMKSNDDDEVYYFDDIMVVK
ncbi:hypothetical protein SAMN05192529_10361 [Arachidicoccus rhizosphaerae]|uniref:IPT/TIG domain-containing protein n=1 Tax=Arachidicoccus rhizosphaerae TaxID=551991 RepID=A0A1H3WKX3_9BACT|nr:hypothetical protein [Arachidicoccus rhizosphaerae]SDZ86992.1 hypothetical protein SAMN05192529_10361 [Arachidicoccus rhizosphaerae]